MLGQIGDPTTGLPGGAGSELWYLSSDSYGNQVTSIGGDDSLLLLESDDYAVASPNGSAILRRLFVPVAWEFGAAVVKVTPIVDFNTRLTAQTFSLPAGATRQKATLDLAIARVCSWVSVRAEVLSRSGYVELLSPLSGAVKPLGVPATAVAGTEP